MTIEIVLAATQLRVPPAPLPSLVERAGGATRFAWDAFFYAEHWHWARRIDPLEADLSA